MALAVPRVDGNAVALLDQGVQSGEGEIPDAPYEEAGRPVLVPALVVVAAAVTVRGVFRVPVASLGVRPVITEAGESFDGDRERFPISALWAGHINQVILVGLSELELV